MPEKCKEAGISIEKVYEKTRESRVLQELVEKRKDKNKGEKKIENKA